MSTAQPDGFLHGAEWRDGASPVRSVPKYHEEELPFDLPTLDEATRAIDAAIHPKQPQKDGTKSRRPGCAC